MTRSSTPARKHKPSLLNVVITSGLTIAVLGWLFHMQGRSYWTAYLGFYGFDHADFPLSTPDLQWLTLIGWTDISIRWVRDSWKIYVELLIEPGLKVFVSLLVLLWIFKSIRHFWPKIRPWIEQQLARAPRPYSSVSPWLMRRAKEILAVSAGVLASVSALPALLWVAAFCLLLAVTTTLLPFDSAGKLAAQRNCSRDLASLNVVRLSDPYDGITSAHRLLCSENHCALISGDRVFVVPRSSIQATELVPAGKRTASDESAAAVEGFCHLFGQTDAKAEPKPLKQDKDV
ncbi:hypothetical protein [Pseudoxanthomonas mexicana]